MPKSFIIRHTVHCRKRSEAIRYIIIHCSSYSPEKQLETLNNAGLSTHYIISKNGKITENCPPEEVAYHAGISRWNNSSEKSLNGCSVGIELESPSLGQNKEDYTRPMMQALYRLLNQLCRKYNIPPENILGHSDIAPARKPDPGKAFPWQKLHRHGLCIGAGKKLFSAKTDEKKLLEIIGYDTTLLAAARYAFCRRFLPEEVTEESDLQKLLNNPFPPDFSPQDNKKYLYQLRAVAASFVTHRTA